MMPMRRMLEMGMIQRARRHAATATGRRVITTITVARRAAAETASPPTE